MFDFVKRQTCFLSGILKLLSGIVTLLSGIVKLLGGIVKLLSSVKLIHCQIALALYILELELSNCLKLSCLACCPGILLLGDISKWVCQLTMVLGGFIA